MRISADRLIGIRAGRVKQRFFLPWPYYVHALKSQGFHCRLFGEENKDKLPSADFLTAVGSLKFRGTSILFRLPQSCMTNLRL